MFGLFHVKTTPYLTNHKIVVSNIDGYNGEYFSTEKVRAQSLSEDHYFYDYYKYSNGIHDIIFVPEYGGTDMYNIKFDNTDLDILRTEAWSHGNPHIKEGENYIYIIDDIIPEKILHPEDDDAQSDYNLNNFSVEQI